MARKVFSIDSLQILNVQKDIALSRLWIRNRLEKRAAKKAGRIVVREARRRAPKLTGRLARSIVATNTGVESRTIYGGVQEFGWEARNITAQPHIYPAIYAQEDKIINLFVKEADSALKVTFPRGGIV